MTWVMIEGDVWVRSTWRAMAAIHGIAFEAFPTMDAFFAARLVPGGAAFLDHHLAPAREIQRHVFTLRHMGYHRVIVTAADPARVGDLHRVDRVIDKTFPYGQF